jgi:hypothetical protein
VRDTIGNAAAAAQALGTFTVAIPPPVRRPRHDLAENNPADWYASADGGTAATAHDGARTVCGAGSIRFTTDGGFDTQLRYRDPSGSDWDLTAADHLYFDVYAENPNSPQFQSNSPWLRLYDGNGGYFEYRYYQDGWQSDPLNSALDQWRSFSVPLRAADNVTNGWRRTVVGTPGLDHIATLEFHADTWGAGFSLWYDRVGFDLPVRVTSAAFAALPSHRLMLRFDQNVAASLATGDLVLQDLTTSAPLAPATMAIACDPAGELATVTFPGQPDACLADGQYRLTLAAGAVEDPAGNPLAADYQFDFSVAADGDSDGMPDAWESANGLDPEDPDDAAADADGDGQTNLTEYRAGTDPRNGSSRFVVTAVVRTAGGVELTWRSAAARQYRIHWSDDQISWLPLTSGGIPVVVPAAGVLTSYSVPVTDSASRRFYRIEALAPY